MRRSILTRTAAVLTLTVMLSACGAYAANTVIIPIEAWESVVGDWKAIDGALVNSDGVAGNTNAFAEVEQEGKILTYEWTVDFKDTTFSLGPAAGLHILSDDAKEAQRGNSYLIFQDKAFIRLYKSSGGRLAKVSEFPVVAALGETHKYRVEFNTSSGVMKIFRDGAEVGTWTDSSPLKSGRYVSVRTNGTIAMFRDIAVTCK